MTINRDAIEQAADLSALRVLVQTVALLTFEGHGFTPEKVRALGRGFAAELADVTVPGAGETYDEAIRGANMRAISALFDAVADGMRTGEG
ncbi:hypothetical protein [Methylobacterium planeticum]|uniref:Uncharacterized protein n=1 Tax=Methylobacterium planeticum TaxID=2615211 RepID=A0A6N6MTU9_9HYPH|nr:hypothetical protein [Methylobacterium planeticum]KAB1074419.1 hypothetical protein F6X51_08640 [Methylobacterium planeticum]